MEEMKNRRTEEKQTAAAVLVTAIGSFSAQTVIAACRKAGYRVVGCDIYPQEWVANSLDTDVFYQAPYATDQKAYRGFMETVCREENLAFVLPLTDAEIDAFQAWRLESPETFEALGAVVCMSGIESIRLCRNKELAAAALREKNVCRTIPGKPLDAFLQDRGEFSFPMILKPVDGRSSQGLQILEDEQQLEYAALRCRGRENRFLVQTRITGNVVTVDVVRQEKEAVCVCLPRRELLRTLNGAGTSVQVFRDAELEETCRRIAEVLDVRGCVNMEFIEHETEQGVQWYFLECNPRFAGGAAFSCAAGYDMAENHLRCFRGESPAPMGEIAPQYIARRYAEYWMG